MSATLILPCILAFAAGLLAAYVFASRRAGQLKADAAGSASAAVELRKQIETLRVEAETNRAKLAQEQTRRAAAEADFANQRANLEEQRKVLAEAEEKLRDAFNAAATKALDLSSQQFLKLAAASFARLQQEATGDLGKREEAIKGLVDPLTKTLKSLEERLTADESSRRQDYGGLAEQVRKLNETGEVLRKETGSLVTSLRQPQIKGKWGELMLKRALELTGMSPFADFDEQSMVDTIDGGRQRPDVIVRLPGGGIIVIDAKVPQGAFLNALSARNQDEYWAAMAEHGRLVRNHVMNLSSRKYWEQFPQSPEFVVLFLPAEAFFSGALEQDRTLIEDAIAKRIVLASPTTLLALLRTVAHGWRQERLAESAQHISELGKKLYDRVITFVDHMEGIRAGLERANKCFNSAVGSLESSVLPSARKLKETGVMASTEIQVIPPTETLLRAPTLFTESDKDNDKAP
jgi:DNA recombination protein RmuC